jgi:hypothetical protein
MAADGTIMEKGRDGQVTAYVPEALVVGQTAEHALLDKQKVQRRVRWGVEFRRAFDRALDGWVEARRRVAERLYGLDGLPPASPAEAAAEVGMEPGEVYRLHDQLKRRLAADLTLYGLDRLAQEINEP